MIACRCAFFRPCRPNFRSFSVAIPKRASQNAISGTKNELRERFPVGSVDLVKDEPTGVALLRLNHADKRNALSGKMMAELHDRVVELESWKTGCGVVFCSAQAPGKPPAFCSGGDLRTMKSLADDGPEGGRKMSAVLQDAMIRFRALPMVSVAAVHGAAMGGGAELITWCDLRAFTPKGQVSFVQIKMGVTPGWGGGVPLVRIVGRSNAVLFLVGGTKRTMNADQALKLGFSNTTLPDVQDGQDPGEFAKEWLLKEVFESGSHPSVIRGAKAVVHSADDGIKELMEREREIFGQVWGGPAQMAALAAFFKKK